MTGPEGRQWTQWHDMLADLVEAVSVGASKDTRYKQPLEYPRPRYPEPTPEASSPAEVAEFFGLRYVPPDGQQEETQG